MFGELCIGCHNLKKNKNKYKCSEGYKIFITKSYNGQTPATACNGCYKI